MLKFVHLTDTHLVPAPRPLYALDPRDRLPRAIDDINRKQPDAAFVVVTGDLAHLGEAAAYAELRAILGRLVMPCHLVIGNHDSRGEFLAAFPNSPRDENGFVQYVVETPLADCVMLDSVVAGDHGGLLCERRLTWLDRVLTERADRDLLLFVHHPPFDIGLPPLDSIRMMNGEALAPRLAAHGRAWPRAAYLFRPCPPGDFGFVARHPGFHPAGDGAPVGIAVSRARVEPRQP